MRIVLGKGEQKKFLEVVRASTGWSWEELARECGICERSMLDWRREKYRMTLESAKKLAKIANMPVPYIIKILPEFWNCKEAGRIGAFSRNAKFGNPGTPEGRRKGGLRSQVLRKVYPERYPNVICRKEIRRPLYFSPLAEFIGIILGDGRISDHQVFIYINNETDVGYEKFVMGLILRLFGLKAAIYPSKDCKVDVVCVSSANLVEYLTSVGLQKGNKVKRQADVPSWILNSEVWMQNCLRGLWDTDGCIYLDVHTINGRKYVNPGMTFTNRSLALLETVYGMMVQLGYSPRNSSRYRLFLRRKNEILHYFREVGTNNPKHLRRFQDYFNLRC